MLIGIATGSCSVQDARFIKSLSLPIYISIDGSFFYTQEHFYLRSCSCSCTTCIVYVNLFKDRLFLIVVSFQKADAKVRTLSNIFQIIFEVFFIFFLPTRRLSYRKGGKRKSSLKLPGTPF